jgi:hypothetical protein
MSWRCVTPRPRVRSRCRVAAGFPSALAPLAPVLRDYALAIEDGFVAYRLI